MPVDWKNVEWSKGCKSNFLSLEILINHFSETNRFPLQLVIGSFFSEDTMKEKDTENEI